MRPTPNRPTLPPHRGQPLLPTGLQPLERLTAPATARRSSGSKDHPMSKEKNKGNKEAKKPKKEAPKVLATANSNAGKDSTTIAGKKIK